MTDNPYRDALRRVLEATPATGDMVDPAAIHDAIGSDVILDVLGAQRWIVGVSTGAGEEPGEGAPLHPEMREDGGNYWAEWARETRLAVDAGNDYQPTFTRDE